MTLTPQGVQRYREIPLSLMCPQILVRPVGWPVSLLACLLFVLSSDECCWRLIAQHGMWADRVVILPPFF
jgi:hypothetical protein